MNKKTMTFSNKITGMMLRGVLIDFVPTCLGMLLILGVSLIPGTTPDVLAIALGIVLFVCIYFAFTSWYSKPINDFAMSYMDIEPVSAETNFFFDKVGYGLVKYRGLFVDRDFIPESSIWG